MRIDKSKYQARTIYKGVFAKNEFVLRMSEYLEFFRDGQNQNEMEIVCNYCDKRINVERKTCTVKHSCRIEAISITFWIIVELQKNDLCHFFISNEGFHLK